MSGVKLEATYRIFSCRKTFLGSLEECINLAGFQVGRFTFSSSYLADLLIDEDDKEIQTLILDLGADATRVSLFEEGALLTSFALPFGGRSITMDIKNSYGIAFQQAEKLKKKFSCALAKEADEDIEILFDSKEGKERSWSLRVVELAGVLQCRLDEIFTGIRYQLVKLSLSDSIEKVLFIGGGTNHKQMKEYLENQFNVPAQKAVLRNDVFLNVNTAEFETWKYANVLGMLAFYLQELVMEETEEVSIFQKISTGFRSFFGGKSAGKDTQM
ncbi:MAG: rod shape-determining protein [Flavobacteriaceae bacterium]|nr:rod shape-determining protein [Flavobacteriaceae bacterium]